MEIVMVSCPNGHMYNAAIHSVCPECGSSSKSVQNSGNFGATEAPMGGSSGNFSKTEAPGAGAGAASYNNAFSKTEAPNAGGYDGGYSANPTIAAGGSPHDISAAPQVGNFGSTMIGGDEYGEEYDTQVAPVVGWLVCIEGPLRGTDFRVHNGFNYIGREEGDIHIQGDMQISRKNHALIAFDNSERAFYVGPAEGRNLLRVNGKAVMNTAEIHNYDVISLGTTKLMFVALCGPHFGWDEGLTNENG